MVFLAHPGRRLPPHRATAGALHRCIVRSVAPTGHGIEREVSRRSGAQVSRRAARAGTGRLFRPASAGRSAPKFHVAPAHKFHVVPLGLELDDYFALRPPAGGGPLTVGWFGRMVPVKNIALLAATIEIALERSQDIRFVIAGDGPDRSALHGLLDRYGGRVEWLGWQREILPAMARCDVVLQTSRNEGTPVALIQGMAAARPFVSTAVGGVVDMVT